MPAEVILILPLGRRPLTLNGVGKALLGRPSPAAPNWSPTYHAGVAEFGLVQWNTALVITPPGGIGLGRGRPGSPSGVPRAAKRVPPRYVRSDHVALFCGKVIRKSSSGPGLVGRTVVLNGDWPIFGFWRTGDRMEVMLNQPLLSNRQT